MFGASLSIKWEDFKFLRSSPKAPLIGLLCQFLILPFVTFLLTKILKIDASIALGMILVASCPGGSFSNIMTWLARGHLATSVSMTGASTVAALFMTPLNFAFYGSLNPETSALLSNIAVAPAEVMKLILIVLILPLIAGMIIRQRFEQLANNLDKPFRWLSMLLFLVFVVVAFSANGALFIDYAQFFVGLVVLHNAIALLIGYFSSRLAGLEPSQMRAVTLEVGIQNSGLGLLIVFNFYPELGGMMIITAFWGVWHLVSGLALATFWSKRSANPAVNCV
ncbi:MAG: bile acid:sodium symporter family protein [Pseudohongiellaceae bacterium]